MRRQVDVKEGEYCRIDVSFHDPELETGENRTYVVYLYHNRHNANWWTQWYDDTDDSNTNDSAGSREVVRYLSGASWTQSQVRRTHYWLYRKTWDGTPQSTYSASDDYDHALMQAIFNVGVEDSRLLAESESAGSIADFSGKDISELDLDGVYVGTDWTIEDGKLTRRKPTTLVIVAGREEVPLELP